MKRNEGADVPAPLSPHERQGHAPVAAISGRIGPSQIGDLCHRVGKILSDTGARTVIVDVSGVIEPDMAALDALARLHLEARRMGREIKIRHTCEQLQELLAFAGLRDVLLGCDAGGVAEASMPRE